MSTEEKINSFAKELGYIKNEGLRKFVEYVLEGTGDWFYKDPASTSGKYHPKFALGNGGLMRHTKAVVYWVQELGRTELLTRNDYQVELLTAAAIMHDIRKHTANGSYISNHARAAANMIMETQKEHPDWIGEQDAKYIANAVSTHMGIWGVKDGERKPMSASEILLHIADYCASRKEISMEFPDFHPVEVKMPTIKFAEETDHKVVTTTSKPVVTEQKQQQQEKQTEQTEQPFTINFGKYRGRTLDDIYNTDKDYLMWIIKQDNFFDKEVQEKIKSYLNSKK